MARLVKNWIQLAVVLFVMAACSNDGRGIPSAKDQSNATEGGEVPDADASPDTSASTCSVSPIFHPTLAACVRAPRNLFDLSALYWHASEPLTVVGVRSDQPTCFVDNVAEVAYLPSDRPVDSLQGHTVGWDFQDSSAQSWTVEFISDSLNADLLAVGTQINFSMRAQDDLYASSGYFVLGVEGDPTVLFAQRKLPTELQDFVAPDKIECVFPELCNGKLASMRVTFAGDSAVLGTGESGSVGGLLVKADWYQVERSGCSDAFDEFIVGAHKQ